MTNLQITNGKANLQTGRDEAGFWNLELGIFLELGAWNLEL